MAGAMAVVPLQKGGGWVQSALRAHSEPVCATHAPPMQDCIEPHAVTVADPEGVQNWAPLEADTAAPQTRGCDETSAFEQARRGGQSVSEAQAVAAQ